MNILTIKTLFIQLLYLFYYCVYCEDFYELLGVARDADNRAIRRAFKKLALTKHPDKNPNNENAHKEFVKLNRAYEVLMDEELRKKYDLHGEEGLSENYGGQYQSWQFYHDNFGIYDDDLEIVTLSRADFEQTVSGKEIWFINFYSTFCSHCHDLAPTFREFARDMDGVIRIGAVNCAEDPMLCRSQNVMSYPTLILYPERRSFNRERTFDALVSFVLDNVMSNAILLQNEDLKLLVKQKETLTSKVWLLSFCETVKDDEDCLSDQNKKKLAIALHGLLEMGQVYCDVADEICRKFQKRKGLVYYLPVKGIEPKDAAVAIQSLDYREIFLNVLKFIPDIPVLTEKELVALVDAKPRSRPALIRFAPNLKEDNLHYKRLLTIVGNDVKVAFVDCSDSHISRICHNLLKMALPKWVMFKTNGGFEINYGKKDAVFDIATFAMQSYVSPLVSLTGDEHADALRSKDTWFIDYFAPWCPPCQRLLFEMRKVHMLIDNVKLGTVDCVAYKDVCSSVGINSYPTTILYSKDENEGRHVHTGYYGAKELAEFVQDALDPVVVELDGEDFHESVLKQESGVMWVVDFFAPWCGPCMELAPEFRRLARNMVNKEFLKFGTVDCDQNRYLCTSNNVNMYPTVRLYGNNGYLIDYPSNWWRDHQSMEIWLNNYLPSKSTALGNNFFSVVLEATEPWLVDFYAPWCTHCIQFAPVFEKIAEQLEGIAKTAKVDCTQWATVCEAAQVNAYPTLKLYLGTKGKMQQSVTGYRIDAQEEDVVIRLVKDTLVSRKKLKKTEL